MSKLRRLGVNTMSTNVDLEASSINPAWVIEGSPQTRWKLLFSTDDGIAQTGIWDCTAGKFHWHYHLDETIHVLEGGMTITFRGTVRDVHAGDMIFFPAGSKAIWNVEHYVRKIAWLRQPVPYPANLAVRIFNRIRFRNYRGQL